MKINIAQCMQFVIAIACEWELIRQIILSIFIYWNIIVVFMRSYGFKMHVWQKEVEKQTAKCLVWYDNVRTILIFISPEFHWALIPIRNLKFHILKEKNAKRIRIIESRPASDHI